MLRLVEAVLGLFPAVMLAILWIDYMKRKRKAK
jgi:hypothetical protein